MCNYIDNGNSEDESQLSLDVTLYRGMDYTQKDDFINICDDKKLATSCIHIIDVFILLGMRKNQLAHQL